MPGVLSWLCIVIAANRDARNVLVINSGNFSAAHVRQLDKTSERSGTLRSIYSCAWMVFVALLLDYLHADAPSSLDFWRCAVCFKGKWPGIGHIDARTKWLTRVAATRRNTAVREGAIRVFFFRRAFVALLLKY